MSVEYSADIIYGVHLDDADVHDLKENLGENWDVAANEFFYMLNAWSSNWEGIFGVKVASIYEGEVLNLSGIEDRISAEDYVRRFNGLKEILQELGINETPDLYVTHRVF